MAGEEALLIRLTMRLTPFPQARSGGKSDAVRQIMIGNPTILLQLPQNVKINLLGAVFGYSTARPIRGWRWPKSARRQAAAHWSAGSNSCA